MFKDEFKQRYTTIPFAIYRAYCEFVVGGVISHQHRETELIAMSQGEADFYIDGKLYRLKKGDVLIVPPYSIHRAETSPEDISDPFETLPDKRSGMSSLQKLSLPCLNSIPKTNIIVVRRA